MAATPEDAELLAQLTSRAVSRKRLWREVKDRAFRYTMWVGGIAVIAAIALIFFYLLYVVFPLFQPARLEAVTKYPLPGGSAQTALLTTEEYGEVGVRMLADGRVVFFDTATGRVTGEEKPEVLNGTPITAFGAGRQNQGLAAYGLADGRALVLKPSFSVSYPQDKRRIDAKLTYPAGEEAVVVDPDGRPLAILAVQGGDSRTTVLAKTADQRLVMARVSKQAPALDFGDGEETVKTENFTLPIEAGHVERLLLDANQTHLVAVNDDGSIDYFDIRKPEDAVLVDHAVAVPQGARITDIRWLAGGISLLVADTRGIVAQWFPVRDVNNKYTLARVREYKMGDQPITAIVPEFFRKALGALDASGRFGLYHTTAERDIARQEVTDKPLKTAVISPRADRMFIEDEGGTLHYWRLHNEHPEVSWHSLWGKVWYESRPQPEYIWQSSAANSDFEPKFSLTPLSLGTLKAAFYAMLFAVPLAIMSAIYTAYFMNPRMREVVKPAIELMGALPTVILGFLAGLWLAPLIESDLVSVLLFFLLVPTAVLLAAWVWSRMPEGVRHRVPDGYEALLLVPVIFLACALAMLIGPGIEDAFFGGNAPQWVTQHLGLRYDQRNSLVVGIAMGFAVVPIVFSISEDAIVGVPKHLTIGSLALGATPWQTLTRVVLLTASPGIFSAVMIGLGRAVGETMIVLMATGNTPVINFNIFEGFRALSANTAVEMPESEVNSTHYRILFLASLILFLFTFLFNTIAEIVRHRLRAKYSHL
ncbi:MAG: ABC transporter permease subunit [Gammaproteobacteria bacterium]